MAATERVWDRFLTDRDKRVFTAAGFGQRTGWGSNPALIIIDVTYAFTGEGDPVEESIKKYPLSCGRESWTAIAQNQKLLAAARQVGIPTYFTLSEFREDQADLGGWTGKQSRAAHSSMIEGSKGGQIVAELTPGPGEIVISKKKPSAFFGSPILCYLIDRHIDTVVITGCTTSGCVRSSVIDAFSYNYKVIVPEECTFDRGQASHALNLFDMHQKYADVLSTDEVISHLLRASAQAAGAASRPGLHA